MRDKFRARRMIEAIINMKGSRMSVLNYLFENDKREPKSDSYAYNHLRRTFEGDIGMTIYLNDKILDMYKY